MPASACRTPSPRCCRCRTCTRYTRRPASGPKFGHHTVEMVPGTSIHNILGDRIVANSFHHQGVADPGRLTPTGWCPEDELIEVVEDPELPFAIGVQWHPEDTDDFRVIAAFVEAAG